MWNLTFDTTTNVVDVYVFGRWQKVESLKSAIVGLGIQRVSDIAMSCGVLNMMPGQTGGIDPVVFWEHSLSCALVCRNFARKISYLDPGKANLAGLLHDIGVIVNLWALPKECRAAFERARAEGVPLHEAELAVLGFTHCESGRLLAERWELSDDLRQVVSFHHSSYESQEHAGLIALVELSDLLCRNEWAQPRLHRKTRGQSARAYCSPVPAMSRIERPGLGTAHLRTGFLHRRGALARSCHLSQMSLDFGNGDRIRVLIVDDSAFMRTSLARMISSEPDMEVAGTARGASDAFEKILSLDPDVITLDVVMPGLDGIGALRCIMDQFPRPVIMVSSAIKAVAEESRRAINAGAFDCVSKQLSPSSLEIAHIRADLVTKIRSAAHPRNKRRHSQSPKFSLDTPALVTPMVVAIGLSTGGPKALEQTLPRFPADLPVPMLIVQHMPAGFTHSLAHLLDSISSIKVCEASHRELIRPGVAYIAPAGLHMHLVPRLSDSKPMIILDRRPKDAEHVPSIDVLMNDAAIGVIMTGMGSDGADGMQAIFDQAGLTLGQDQASCAVYGMPRACAKRGVLTRVVSLSDIPTRIVRAVARRGPA